MVSINLEEPHCIYWIEHEGPQGGKRLCGKIPFAVFQQT
ncbi:hypothetical protein M2E15_1615 [Bacillus mycoides]|nr:hypothetical protein M2E15_1615 [Bacillus mycoides]